MRGGAALRAGPPRRVVDGGSGLAGVCVWGGGRRAPARPPGPLVVRPVRSPLTPAACLCPVQHLPGGGRLCGSLWGFFGRRGGGVGLGARTSPARGGRRPCPGWGAPALLRWAPPPGLGPGSRWWGRVGRLMVAPAVPLPPPPRRHYRVAAHAEPRNNDPRSCSLLSLAAESAPSRRRLAGGLLQPRIMPVTATRIQKSPALPCVPLSLAAAHSLQLGFPWFLVLPFRLVLLLRPHLRCLSGFPRAAGF